MRVHERSHVAARRPIHSVPSSILSHGFFGMLHNNPQGAHLAAKTVAVVGASADRRKFGNKAVRAFRDAGWIVYPIHPVLKQVEGLPAFGSLDALPVTCEKTDDQVSFYVPPRIGSASGCSIKWDGKRSASYGLIPAGIARNTRHAQS